MPSLSDTDLASGSQPFYQVILNGKLWSKPKATRAEAELEVKALAIHGMSATITVVGKNPE